MQISNLMKTIQKVDIGKDTCKNQNIKISSFIVDETEDNEPSELSIVCKYNYTLTSFPILNISYIQLTL